MPLVLPLGPRPLLFTMPNGSLNERWFDQLSRRFVASTSFPVLEVFGTAMIGLFGRHQVGDARRDASSGCW